MANDLSMTLDLFNKATNSLKRFDERSAKTFRTIQQANARINRWTPQRGKTAQTNQDSVAAAIEKATLALAAQNEKLEKLGGKLEKLGEKPATSFSKAKAFGAGASKVGGTMVKALKAPMEQAVSASQAEDNIRQQGLSEAQSEQAIAFARKMRVSGISTVDSIQLVGEAYAMIENDQRAQSAALALAKVKATNAARFNAMQAGQKTDLFKDMLRVIESRGAAQSPEELTREANDVQQMINATNGRIPSSEFHDMISTGGEAVQRLESSAVYQHMPTVVQKIGGKAAGEGLLAAKQNLYQGQTNARSAKVADSLGLYDDASKITRDRLGNIKHVSQGALKGAELFQNDQFEWMEKVLLPAMAAKGITQEKDILAKFKDLFSNDPSANLLYSNMYLQRGEIRKNAERSPRFDNIETGYAKAAKSPKGVEDNLIARRDDLYERIGTALLPLYVAALEKVTVALEWVIDMMDKYPGITKAVAEGFAIIGVALQVIGYIIQPIVMLLEMLSTLKDIPMVARGLGMIGRVFAWLGRIVGRLAMGLLGRLGSLLPMLGRIAGRLLIGMFMGLVGRLLMHPVALGVAALSLAAYAIYQNWDRIKQTWNDFKAEASRIWDNVKNTMLTAWDDAKNGASRIWGNVKTTWNDAQAEASRIWGSVKNTVVTTWSDAKTQASSIWGNVKDNVLAGWNGVKTEAPLIWDSVKNQLISSWNDAKNTLPAIWDETQAKLLSTWDSLKAELPVIWTSIKDSLLSVWNNMSLTSTGGQLMDDLKQGIAPRLKSIIDFITGEGATNEAKAKNPYLARAEQPVDVVKNRGATLEAGHKRFLDWLAPVAALSTAMVLPAQAKPLQTDALRIDHRPPLTTSIGRQGQQPVAGSTYQITINAAPGMEPQVIARAVSAELDRRERERRSKVYSEMRDIDG